MNMLDLDAARAIAPYAYVGSPYSLHPDGLEEAFREVCRATAWLIQKGVRCHSPIAHTHPIAIHGGIDPLDHELWMEADRPFVEGAGGLIVVRMRSWEESKGLAHEIDAFRGADKPVLYLDWPHAGA